MLKEQHPSLNLHKAAEGWLVQKEIFQIAGKKKWEFFVCICEVLSRAASTALLTDILVIFMLKKCAVEEPMPWIEKEMIL